MSERNYNTLCRLFRKSDSPFLIFPHSNGAFENSHQAFSGRQYTLGKINKLNGWFISLSATYLNPTTSALTNFGSFLNIRLN